MLKKTQTNNKNDERGGITIMVTLSLLVLLTVAAISMSKNSFKEIKSSGYLKQGAMARNVADSGIQWSIYWIDQANSSETIANNFIALKNELARDNSRSGRVWDVRGNIFRPGGNLSTEGVLLPQPSTNPGFVPGEPDYEQGFTVGLTRMGKLPVTDLSQGVGAGAFSPAAGGSMLQAPDLWAVRSDAQIRPVGVNFTFTHTKEAWISTPVR